LQAQQAEHPKALFKLHKLLEALLKVSPSGQIKYGQLRRSLLVACKKFGMELLAPHSEVEHAHLPGKASDALGVLLKHWRRVTFSQAAWDRFGSKLEESHFSQLQRLYKMTEPEGQAQKPKRELTTHINDVTVESTAMPAMLKTSSEEGDDNSSDCGRMGSLMESPPPVAKVLWREKAGRLLKKPATKAVEKAGPCKRPATKHMPKKARLAGGATTKIHTASLSVGGGKNQSYIQHIPGPGTEKRIIVACTAKQAAALKISHKALMQDFYPHVRSLAPQRVISSKPGRIFSKNIGPLALQKGSALQKGRPAKGQPCKRAALRKGSCA